jgi:hypothetical protein
MILVPRRTGFAFLPLHRGNAPAWLFGRMVRLSREIVIYLASEHGMQDILRRLPIPSGSRRSAACSASTGTRAA